MCRKVNTIRGVIRSKHFVRDANFNRRGRSNKLGLGRACT